MSGRFWAIIGVIAVIFVGFLIFGGDKDDKKNTGSNGDTATTSNHIKGKTDSKVKLMEYGDFQCPTCSLYYPVVKEVYAKYQDKIAFQFRNLPLTQLHNHAFAAARAAEAASMQGKFWEMHDMLYEGQNGWSGSSSPTNTFKQYAKNLGLNETKFMDDFASSSVNKTINNDIDAFKATESDMATPTFFLNGKKLELRDLVDETGQPQAEKFSAKIDEALKQQ
jgi:protein-disulfide isomerase